MPKKDKLLKKSIFLKDISKLRISIIQKENISELFPYNSREEFVKRIFEFIINNKNNEVSIKDLRK